MARSAPLHSYSFAEYLELEAASNIRHEYWNGEIYAMGGGSPAHAALAMAIGSALIPQLRGGDCRVYSSGLMVRVKASGLATYPDVTVVCGALETDPQSRNTVTNPKVIVEVLGDNTAAYDRGEKLEEYKTVGRGRASGVTDFPPHRGSPPRRARVHDRDPDRRTGV